MRPNVADVTCFMIEPTGEVSVYARRYQSVVGQKGHFHQAKILQHIASGEVVSGPPTEEERNTFVWPTTCQYCRTYVFVEEDTWQRLQCPRYTRPADEIGGATTFDLEDAPVGAIWEAPWYPWKGPDGKCLMLKLPNGAGEFIIDGPASNGGTGPPPHWERTGAAPNLTVKPSIGRPHLDGQPGYKYHGWLRDGVLTDA